MCRSFQSKGQHLRKASEQLHSRSAIAIGPSSKYQDEVASIPARSPSLARNGSHE